MPPRTRQATGHLPPTSRKRKSLADSPEDNGSDSNAEVYEEDLGLDVDPDFKALSRRQRRRIDEVFEGASGGGRSNKRRKVEGGSGGDGGGFMMDEDMGGGGGGGFTADDFGGGGGFMADDDDMMGGGFKGGFLAEQSLQPVAEPTAHLYEDAIPLSLLPDLFQQLDLPFDDDVLATLKGMYIPPVVGAGNNAAELGPGAEWTTKRDFRAVCAALMEPEEEEEVRVKSTERRLRRESDSDDEDEDVYVASQGEDDAMDIEPNDEDDDDVPTPDSPLSDLPTSKSKSKPKTSKSQSQGTSDLRLDAAQRATKLSKDQKGWVVMMWNTMFEGTESAPSIMGRGWGGGPKVLGKEQVRRWAGLMEQNWSDVEITEMIEVFSTVPGKRGLSFDDFQTLLIRAGQVG